MGYLPACWSSTESWNGMRSMKRRWQTGWYTFVWLDENHRDEAMWNALYSVAVRAVDGEILLVERGRDMAGSVPRTVDWQGIKPGDAVRLSRSSGEKIPILEEPWLPSLPAAEQFLSDGAVAA